MVCEKGHVFALEASAQMLSPNLYYVPIEERGWKSEIQPNTKFLLMYGVFHLLREIVLGSSSCIVPGPSCLGS